MKELKKIIFTKENIIIDCIETTEDIQNIKSIHANCKVLEVDYNSEYGEGDNIAHFSKEGKKYSNKELIQKKIIKLAKDEKLNDTNGTIEKITDELELIELGIKTLDQTQKIITLPDGSKQLTVKTFDELLSENLVPPDELLAHKKQEATARLSQIDIESIRPLRAVLDNIATDEDHAILSSLNEEATDLRKLLASQ